MHGKIVVILVFAALVLSLTAAQGQEVIETWVARYNGPGNATDWAHALAVDDAGNVYVTGASWGSGTYNDYATIKYDPVNGDTLWAARYNGPGNGYDGGYSLAVDDSGNVYVTGSSYGGGTSGDYATIKYDPVNGDTLWVARYNGQANGAETARALALDDSGNVYVTGYSDGNGSGSDYATIKYGPDGTELWVARYEGTGNDDDYVYALALDAYGNVYVTGDSYEVGTSYDIATIKYDPVNGDSLWVARYNGPGNDYDGGYSLAVDDSGNVYVTGESDGGGTGYDYATIKYDRDGTELWVARYDGTGNSSDEANALAVDDSGNVYVTGESYGSGTVYDYATIKYSPNGDTLWVARYNGPGNSNDTAYALALDDAGNIYVTGSSYGGGTSGDYATVKYDPDGTELWVARYNGQANGAETARALALDDSGNVYVTGYSEGSGTGNDYATIKYIQLSPDLELSATSLDFGTVTVGEQADLPLMISNVGGDTLVLYDVLCGTTVFSTDWVPADSLVLPYSSLEVTITFTPDTSVAYSDTLNIDNNCEECLVPLSGTGEAVVGVSDEPLSLIPDEFALRGPYPNPFNPVTTFNIELPAASWVKLEIFDVGGRSLDLVVDGWRSAGYHEVTFDAAGLASGMYVYRLEAGDYRVTGKMVLMK